MNLPPRLSSSPSSRRLALLAAGASVPEQLPCYVRTAGGAEVLPCSGAESSVLYLSGESAVLVAYPPFIPEMYLNGPEVPLSQNGGFRGGADEFRAGPLPNFRRKPAS